MDQLPGSAPHIEEEVLDRYAIGNLAANALPAVEEHLLSCEDCRARLREADQFVHLFSLAASQVEFRAVPGWKKALQSLFDPLLLAGVAMVLLSVPVIRVWIHRAHVPEAEVVLMESLRGAGDSAQVSAGRPARLLFDIPSTSGACQLRILDTNGAVIQQMRTIPAQDTHTGQVGTRPAASVDKLARGDYWLRLYCEGNDELTAEYSLNAK